MVKLRNRIEERIKMLGGEYGIYFSDLTSSECFFVGNTDEFVAAGIVKLFILLESIRHVEEGITEETRLFKLRDSDRTPSIGVLAHLHEGLELYFSDLYKLMIRVSDNTATNMLIDYLGIHSINETLRKLGMKNCTIRRSFFDEEAIKMGLENTFSIREVGMLFSALYQGKVFSKEASKKILDILKLNQRDYVMSYFFKERVDVAHQMGEEEVDGITHDTGIIYSDAPFVLCMGTQYVNNAIAQGIMRDIALMCYDFNKIRNYGLKSEFMDENTGNSG